MPVVEDGTEFAQRYGRWEEWPRYVGKCDLCLYRTLPFLVEDHAEDALVKHRLKQHRKS